MPSLLDGLLVSAAFDFSFPLPKKSFAEDSRFAVVSGEGFEVSFAGRAGLGFAAGAGAGVGGRAAGGGGRRFVRRFTRGFIIEPYVGYDSTGSSGATRVCSSRVQSVRTWSSWVP